MAEKKETKKSKSYQIHKIYDKGKAKNKSCPKCGQGYFLAAHKSRLTCGHCHYTEFLSKRE